MRVLVLNPGSSSLKATLLEPPEREPLATTSIDWGADATTVADPGEAVEAAIDAVAADAGDGAPAPDAVGYRVVHGGSRFAAPAIIDNDVEAAIRELADLAPLHNRVAADAIRAGRAALPRVPHIAVFDTTFHASLPPAGYRYPVPNEWFQTWGIRRFGFHGISVEWSARRAAELLDQPARRLRLVVAHLGSGCSVTAVDGGRSVDTSMGMTPLEGLMMGTRAGSIDPGVVLRLIERHGQSVDALSDALDHRSGLLGVSGRSSDVRELLRAEAAGDDASELALALFVRRAAQGIAAAATSLPTLDALVFTGGIGEHSGELRSRIVARLATLGLSPIDTAEAATDGRLDDGGAGPAILRVQAREDVVIAEAAATLAAT